MMFMIPIPPTINETDAMLANRIVIMRCDSAPAFAISAG
jgi:hypothetical protein